VLPSAPQHSPVLPNHLQEPSVGAATELPQLPAPAELSTARGLAIHKMGCVPARWSLDEEHFSASFFISPKWPLKKVQQWKCTHHQLFLIKLNPHRKMNTAVVHTSLGENTHPE